MPGSPVAAPAVKEGHGLYCLCQRSACLYDPAISHETMCRLGRVNPIHFRVLQPVGSFAPTIFHAIWAVSGPVIVCDIYLTAEVRTEEAQVLV